MTPPQVPTVPTNSEPIEWVLDDEPGIPKGAPYFIREEVRHFFGVGGWLPQVPIPAGIEITRGDVAYFPFPAKALQDASKFVEPIQGTSIDPSLLNTLEKAVNTAKPMGAK